MIVGLDIDNVLADFQGGWAARYEQAFDRKPTVLNTWDALVDGTHFNTAAEFWAWADSVPGFWRDLPPVKGATGGVYDLLEAGHQLVLITNRHPETRLQTFDWVEKHWPLLRRGLPQINFVKHGEKGKIPAQIYVDDSPNELTALKAEKPAVVRFKQPWNKDLEVPGLLTAATWRDLVDLIDAIGRGDDFTTVGVPETESPLDKLDRPPSGSFTGIYPGFVPTA